MFAYFKSTWSPKGLLSFSACSTLPTTSSRWIIFARSLNNSSLAASEFPSLVVSFMTLSLISESVCSLLGHLHSRAWWPWRAWFQSAHCSTCTLSSPKWRGWSYLPHPLPCHLLNSTSDSWHWYRNGERSPSKVHSDLEQTNFQDYMTVQK